MSNYLQDKLENIADSLINGLALIHGCNTLMALPARCWTTKRAEQQRLALPFFVQEPIAPNLLRGVVAAECFGRARHSHLHAVYSYFDSKQSNDGERLVQFRR